MILEHKPMTSAAGSRQNEVKESPSINPDRPVLAVAPLNSVPYIGPQMPSSNNDSRLPTETKSSTKEAEPVERNGPAMIFLPSSITKEEWNNVMETTKVGVALTGSAAMGKIGPTIGLVDIGESEDSYLFRVSLPGVSREEKDFSCNIDSEGKIIINGVTTTGEKLVCKHSQIFHMQTQNLCPPGRFSISIQLPGPVDPQQISGSFGIDGILEGTVKKKVYYE